MKILIIVAMDKELDLLLPLLSDAEEGRTSQGYRYFKGTVGKHEVIAAKCGIGKVNAALSAASLIERFSPALVINSGVAGGIAKGSRPLDTVVGARCGYHDVWCGPGTEYGQAYGCPPVFEAPAELLETESLRENKEARLFHGTIASGDIFITEPEQVAHILSLYPDALVADMESAAIAQTCFLKNVDFLSVRVVSDTPGSSDNIAQYNDFWTQAPRQTFSIVNSLLNELN